MCIRTALLISQTEIKIKLNYVVQYIFEIEISSQFA